MNKYVFKKRCPSFWGAVVLMFSEWRPTVSDFESACPSPTALSNIWYQANVIVKFQNKEQQFPTPYQVNFL